MISYAFRGGTTVEVWDSAETTRVTLPGGAVVMGMPHPTQAYLDHALEVGYGSYRDPRWGLCRDHELTHCWLAEARDLAESPTLRAVAEGKAREHVGDENVPGWQWLEEREVLALQRFWLRGDHNDDPGGVLSALQWELGNLHDARADYKRRFCLPYRERAA